MLVEHINRIDAGHVMFAVGSRCTSFLSMGRPNKAKCGSAYGGGCMCMVPVGVLPQLGSEVFPLWGAPGGICSVVVWRLELPFPFSPGVCLGAHPWLQSGCRLSGRCFERMGCSA